MTTKPTIKKISIKDLSLWDENPRFPDRYLHKNEKELIRHLVSKEDYEILDLARKIVDGFYTPPLEKLVVFKTKNENIVLEGNRRLACYKLLINPELIDTKIKKDKLEKLKSQIDITDKHKLECIVTDNKEQGLLYVEEKHIERNNEIGWGDSERAIYKARKNKGNANKEDLLKLRLSSKIRELNIPESIQEKVLGKGYVTTLWRLLTHKPAWDLFGYDTGDDNLKTSDKQFDKKLVIIIDNVINKVKFKNKQFSRMRVEEIESYLTKIPVSHYTKAKSELNKKDKAHRTPKANASKTDTSKQKLKPKSSQRETLIPEDCILFIDNTRINDIYHELRKDLLLNDSNKSVPNAVGVLFRVFLEVSLNYYAEKNGITFKAKATIRQKIDGVSKDLTEHKGHPDTKFKSIRKVGSSGPEQSYLSIGNLHEYVHSSTIQPTSGELKGKWDNLQEFFEILWGELSEK